MLGVLVAIAAALRLSTLSAKGFWGDEVSTLFLAREHLGPMLHGIARLESTPPLYYVLAKGWYALFGGSEAAMRSLPALLGVATVPAAYLAAAELVSRRAAMVTAALIAVNPVLIWYSGEARSYALVVLLSALGLWAFAAALHGRRRALAWWALVSCAALATHYFAAFLIAPEAFFLLRARGPSRALLLALVAPAATAGALLPLALQQSSYGHTSWIARTPLILRVLRTPGDLLVGFDAPAALVLGAAVTLLAAVGMRRALTGATQGRHGRGVVLAAKLGLAAVALPALLALAGVDYFDSRNVIPALVPLVVVGAAGFAARRGRAAMIVPACLCATSLAVVAATASEPKYHSEDWRTAAQALGPEVVPRAIVVAPGQAGRKTLEVYLRGARPVFQARARVREVDVVVLPLQGAERPAPPVVARLASLRLRGFHLAGRRTGSHFDIFRYRAPAPLAVTTAMLSPHPSRLGPAVLLQR